MRVSSTPISGVIPSTPVAWATPHILAIATGRILRTYTVDSSSSVRDPLAVLEGHTGAISTVIALPGMRIASAGEDGTVRIWDVVTGQTLRVFDLAHPVLHMTYLPSEQLLCLTSRSLLHVRLARDRSKRRRQLVRKILSDTLSMPTRVVASADGSVIAVSDSTSIHLTGLEAGGVTTSLRCRRIITALAITRDGNTLAAADESGIISLYHSPRNLLGTKRRFVPWEKATPTQLHWHAAAAQALAFAHDDSVLLSAGREAVLVTWRLTPALFGTRTFLPRLRSAILAVAVSPDERKYALSQSDNAVRLVDQLSSGVVRAIRAVPTQLLDFSDGNPKGILSSRVNPQYVETCSVAEDPRRHGNLWFAGTGPSLQLFDAFGGSIVDEIQIIPRNAVSKGSRMDKNDSGSSPAMVTALAVHSSGCYLATVDSQDLHTIQSERYGTDTAVHMLKFWRRETCDQPFVLDAVIPQPHGSDCSISSLSFHPKLPLLATTSRVSRSFKLWRATHNKGEGCTGWRSEIELDYKGMDCNGVCFSSDGSLLVVACEHVLTMWQIEDKLSGALNATDKLGSSGSSEKFRETSPQSVNVDFLHALVHPPAEERIVSVSFVFKLVPLLIAVTRNGIYVWNALSQSIWWSTRIRSESRKLAVDPDSGRFALQLVIPPVGTAGEDCESAVKQTGTGRTITAKPLMEGTATRSPKENAATEPTSFLQNGPTNQDVERDPHDRCTEGKTEALTCTDAAVAIYDAISPVPRHIQRLPTGAKVAALSFVKRPGQGNESQGNQSQSALVCVDSRMEVFLYGDDNGAPFHSARVPADELRIKKLQPAGNLAMILGKETGDEDFIREIPIQEPSSDTQSLLGPTVNKAFGIHFHGLTHVQAPAAVNSFEFINALLMGDREGRRNQRERPLGMDIPANHEADRYHIVSRNGLGESRRSPNAEMMKTGEDSKDPDSRAIRTFCVSMIRKGETKPVSAR